jgi:hypothetical protein
MSETTTQRPYRLPIPETPTEVLHNLVPVLLAPLLLGAANNDIDLARGAAVEAMAAFRARTEADLITIALIIGFGITGLASLSQSMDPAIPLALALRLRGNANNCHRSAEQNRRTLKSNHPAPKAPPPPPPPEPQPVPPELIARAAETRKRTAEHLAQFATPQRAATLAANPAPTDKDRHHQAVWAAGFAHVAAETAADLANMSPEERRNAEMWLGVLDQCANQSMTSAPGPRLRPGDLAFMQANP